MIRKLGEKRSEVVHGTRAVRTFDAAAAHYLRTHMDKVSIKTEAILLAGIMQFIGHLQLHQVHDSTLAPFTSARLAAGRAHKAINLALGVVRRILNLAATSWRDESGKTWLEQAPKITLLPLVGHQREPKPITWGQQRTLLQRERRREEHVGAPRGLDAVLLREFVGPRSAREDLDRLRALL